MIRSAAAIRASLAQLVPGTSLSRRTKATLLLECATAWHNTTTAARCRSVREQSRHLAQPTDGLPSWL